MLPPALLGADSAYWCDGRGGGEYGIDWRNAGSKEKKQNVFDDFQACAEHLITAGYTNPAKLTIQVFFLQSYTLLKIGKRPCLFSSKAQARSADLSHT